MRRYLRQRGARHVGIVETARSCRRRSGRVSWPLPASSSTSPGAQHREAAADRVGAVADLVGAGAGGEDGAADRGGVLAARIVVGDDDDVGELLGDRAHLRPLAGIAVAAAAEHHDELAGAMGAQRGERVLERVGRVRVIDDDRRAVGMRPTRSIRPGAPVQRRAAARRRAPRSAPVAIARPSAASAFIAWNAPISGSETRGARRQPRVNSLAGAFGSRRDEAQIAALACRP